MTTSSWEIREAKNELVALKRVCLKPSAIPSIFLISHSICQTNYKNAADLGVFDKSTVRALEFYAKKILDSSAHPSL